jgi:hypothetical protein
MGTGGQTTASAILSASSADYIMSSPQVKKLSQINQALDSMTQIMTGGPGNAAALFQVSAAAPATVAQAMATAPGGRLSTAQQNQIAAALAGDAGAARKLMSGALAQGPFTTAGAAAWSQFAGPQGIIAASQQNMDQLRTFMTMGGLSGPQAGQLGAFELKQSVMPYAGQSPMALAMLQQQAMQAGVPGVMMGQSYAQTQRAINAHAGTMQQANQLMTRGTQAVANIPGVANFLNPQANISPLQSALYAQMAQQSLALAGHPGAAALRPLMSTLTAAGVKPGQMQVSVDAILKNLNVSPGALAQVNAAISGSMKPITPKVTPPKIPDVGEKRFIVAGKLNMPPIKPVPDMNFNILGKLHMPPVPRVQDQWFTIHGNVVISGAAALAAAAPAAGGAFARIHAQTGGLVPGTGFGDIVHAMLEPGEAIIPRSLVPLIAPFLAAHHIPGFGGTPIGASSHFAAGGVVPWIPDPTRLQWAQIDARYAQGQTGSLHIPPTAGRAAAVNGLAVQIISELAKAISAAKAHSLATALVSKLATEMQYAKTTGANALAGFNISSMDLTQGSTTGGMQTYLQGLQSFSKDIGSLGKAGLNKTLLQQLISAGPSSDPVAQDLLGMNTTGGNSVKLANSLFGQIQKASSGFGYTAAGAIYGGSLGPRSAQGISAGGVNINISVGSGGGGLSLSDAQIKQLVALIQQKLLQQAKRSGKTGVALPRPYNT